MAVRRSFGLKMKEHFLFVCVENSGRSQMAEAFANRIGLSASSAGTLPSDRVSPDVVEVMKEEGIDLSTAVPKILTRKMIESATLVITMGCSVEEVCPRPILAKMRKKLIDWQLEDPKGKPPQRVREIRDEVKKRVEGLAGGSLGERRILQ
jgi:protein-tyrosine-phosphatase